MEEQIKQALETYKKYAKVYADYLESKIIQFQLNKFVSLLPKKAKVLDIGCGAGRDCRYFKEEGVNVVGIDLCEELLKEAKSKAPKIKFEKQDMLKTKFKDEEFDGLWCMASFSDIPKKNNKKALKEFCRILKKGGIIYIAVKEGEGEKVVKKPQYEDSPRFYAFYNQKELVELLKEKGFEIMESEVSNDSRNSWVEVFARKA